jgi:hypothetical protein
MLMLCLSESTSFPSIVSRQQCHRIRPKVLSTYHPQSLAARIQLKQQPTGQELAMEYPKTAHTTCADLEGCSIQQVLHS